MALSLDPKVAALIDGIDLTNAKQRLMDPNKQWKWSQAKANQVEVGYKRFLKMIAAGMQNVVPTLDIDELWHLHILDTSQYMEDCKRCIGRYVHHFPYIGDTKSADGFQRTKDAHRELFGEEYVDQQKRVSK